MPRPQMLITTTPDIPGRQIVETLGLVRGATVRSKHLGTDIVAGLKNLVGGEIKGYSAMLGAAREQAIDRMIDEAQAKGADAIVGFRMDTAAVMSNAAELVAYGTAVRLA